MVSPEAGPAALLIGVWRLHRRGRQRPKLLVVSLGARFALPAEQRFDLALTSASRAGPGWLELVFSDRPEAGLLLIRDQLDASAWRRLRLAIRDRL